MAEFLNGNTLLVPPFGEKCLVRRPCQQKTSSFHHDHHRFSHQIAYLMKGPPRAIRKADVGSEPKGFIHFGDGWKNIRNLPFKTQLLSSSVQRETICFAPASQPGQ